MSHLIFPKWKSKIKKIALSWDSGKLVSGFSPTPRASLLSACPLEGVSIYSCISKGRVHQDESRSTVSTKPPLSPNPSLWLLSHPDLWASLTSVFHSTSYLAFLSPALGQLGKDFGPEPSTLSEEFPLVNCLTLCWVRVGGFDSCRERCCVLG